MEKSTFFGWLGEWARENGLLPKQSAAPPVQFSEAQVKERETAAAKNAREDAEKAAGSRQLAADVKARVTTFVEAGVKAGTFLPAWKEAGIPLVIERALLEGEVEFAEGKKQNPGEALLAFFGGMPKIVPLGEHAAGAGQDPDAALKAEFAAGMKLHEQLGVTFEMFKKQKAAKAA